MSPRDLWAFEGIWQLQRRIDDHLGRQTGAATGQAALSRDPGGLRYAEAVTLHLPGQPAIQGTQAYLWRASPGGIAVQFADGRAFHDISLADGTSEATHWCDPDHYDVQYDFGHWPRWSSLWQVRGPRKHYAMQTVYLRA